MNDSFKKKDFAKVKKKYIELIKKLRDYEERYEMVILDYFYDYDKIWFIAGKITSQLLFYFMSSSAKSCFDDTREEEIS